MLLCGGERTERQAGTATGVRPNSDANLSMSRAAVFAVPTSGF
jgi:hypothetical protein